MKKIKVANAPCSWGVLEFELDQKPHTFDRVLDEMAQAGYAGTELGDWGFMPTDALELQNELSRRNLSMLAAFVPVALAQQSAHQEGIETAVKTARLLARVSPHPFIVLSDNNGTNDTRTRMAGRITEQQQLTESQWKTFTSGAEAVARAVLEETGVKTVFHHHCAGFIETPAEIERFLQSTNPLLIGLCLDTGHYTFGGGDALAGYRKHADRVWHVHFKDCQSELAKESREDGWDYFESVRRGIFCELGKGTVDFAGLTRELVDRGYGGWIVVEQDVLPGMGTPLESAIRNRSFLESIGI
ncbi:MAG: TIM barrel protein [Candidatus Obscuribacterales bacterium]|nr:MAG: xylose isomerase [Candidatus Melainabacteria bacterium]